VCVCVRETERGQRMCVCVCDCVFPAVWGVALQCVCVCGRDYDRQKDTKRGRYFVCVCAAESGCSPLVCLFMCVCA